MKKVFLLTAAILAISSSIMAEEGNVSGMFSAGTSITDPSTSNKYTIKRVLADGFIEDSSWNGFSLGYYVFREDNANPMLNPLMVAELNGRYSQFTNWGRWSAVLGMCTEYTGEGVKAELSTDYKLGKTTTLKVMTGGKKVSGDTLEVEQYSLKVGLSQKIKKGELEFGYSYDPVDSRDEDGKKDDPRTMSVRVSYSQNLTENFNGRTSIEYQTGENYNKAYDESDNDIKYLKIAIGGVYNVTKDFAVDTQIMRKIAETSQSASASATSLDLALRYKF